jgi:hypothetical protein
MPAPGTLDQQDQSGEGDDFTDEDAGSDDLADDASVAVSESQAAAESTFEPPPAPPEEAVHVVHPEHVAHSDVDHAPAPSEVASTSEPVVTSEPSDPFAREQS